MVWESVAENALNARIHPKMSWALTILPQGIYYTSIFQRVLRGMLIKRTTYVNNLQILGTIQVHSRKLRVRT